MWGELNDDDDKNENDDDNEILKDECKKYEDDDHDDDYIFQAKICKRLSRELGLEEMKYDESSMYDVPKEHGLTNCNMIIPSYYQLHKHPSKILTIDYFEIIKDDIRNFRELNKYQLDYIKTLSHEDKNYLFDIYNQCSKLFSIIINESDN